MKDNYVYKIRSSLYLNITNRCSNQCDFCVRNYSEGLAGVRLFLNKEPDFDEIKQAIEPHLKEVKEIVFCGYGEPTYRINLLVEICHWLRKVFKGKIRLNTNGQGNLINQRNVLDELKGNIDQINISLNATSSEEYLEICQPEFQNQAYTAILDFIQKAKMVIPRVAISAVTSSGVDMDKIESIAEKLGVEMLHR